MKKKTCKQCEKQKPTESFPKSDWLKSKKARVGDGFRPVCKQCVRENILAAESKWDIDRVQSAKQMRLRAVRKWRKNHPISAKASYANSHAKHIGATGVLTMEEVRVVWDQYGGKCWVCGDSANQLDHIIPLNKKGGGTNTPGNIRPICNECNHKRSHKWKGHAVANKEAELLKQIKQLFR